ncbi:winged helix turn helix protein [Rhizoctonia solani AG-3 Rhs1AP]|uniref:Winged helix turn helix protein n=2 Tax=Rhizoctonia solani AG-3 TaxID=1086053 RepID=A0A074RMI0_9AGAM|nr:winged helix turn helix protein [Rhizoctonia solani AG-3 Rhs1AP]KEP45908.1 winged helix turn helix protein [Rhizoctonia solani 123E]
MPATRTIAPEMRAHIVHWRCHENRPAVECAELSGRSLQSIYNIVDLYDTHNTLHNPLARPRGRPRILNEDDCKFICGLIEARPTTYLDEIQLVLEERHHIYVTLGTIWNTLARLDLTHKSVSREAYERDELLRAAWQVQWGGYPANAFVWLDESAVNNTTALRLAGWAPRGQACVQREFFFRGVQYSMLPALTTDGIVALDIFEGSINRERFLDFFRAQVAPLLNPFTPAGAPRSIVVLDNCSIHHGDEIRHIIEDECGAKLCYLPAYSPNFNPIEQAFAAIKAHLRRQGARFVGPEARPWLIHEAAWAVTREDAASWIRLSGYSGLFGRVNLCT